MSFTFSPVMPSVANDVRAQERAKESAQRASAAQGVGGTEKESQAASDERDADGRQAWRWTPHQKKQDGEQDHKVHDLSGKVGGTLDLDG